MKEDLENASLTAEDIDYSQYVQRDCEKLRSTVSAGHSLDDFYEPQEGGALCGLASAVICMNKLNGNNHFSQSDLLGRAENAYWPNKEAYRRGLCMTQVAAIIRGCSFSVDEYRALEPARTFTALLSALHGGQLIIANFWRNYKSHRGGHFSPLSLLSTEPTTSPMVYLMDTSASRAKPHWLPLWVMAVLMCRPDRVANCSRGFLVITRQEHTVPRISNFPATHVRLAKASDISEIWGIIQEAFEPVAQLLHRQPSSLTITQHHLHTLVEKGQLYILETTGNEQETAHTLLGTFTLRVSKSWNSLHISHVAIKPSCQGCGLGRFVMDEAETLGKQWYLEHGNSVEPKFTLSTYKQEERLVAFYEKRGYSTVQVTERLGNRICWMQKEFVLEK